MTTTDRASARYSALRAERRDVLAAHRTLLDCGITQQTAEVAERLTELDCELDDLTVAARAIRREAT